jgi:uncharacterized surface protein with fasciclin (FAS1) repeats
MMNFPMTKQISVRLLTLLMTFSFSLTFVGCDDDEEDVDVVENTIAQQIDLNQDYTLLAAGLEASGLYDDLNMADQNYTLLAPPDAALINAGVNSPDAYTADQWREILSYHVITDEILLTELYDEAELDMLQGTVYLSQLQDNVAFNGTASVFEANVGASNGVIHAINGILMPPEREVSAIIEERDDLETLQAAIERLGLADDLSQAAPYTIFAPSDDAFEELLDALEAGGLSQVPDDQLTEILQYHVVSSRVFSSDLEEGNVNTLLGMPFSISFDGGLVITDASDVTQNSSIDEANILGTNGVIHVIDEVLLPE